MRWPMLPSKLIQPSATRPSLRAGLFCETAMHTKLMFDPIAVSVGPGHRRELSTLSELHQFMDEFDPSRRGKAYGATARAVEAARTGEGSIEQASAAFLTFAKAAGILWPDDGSIYVKPSVQGFGGYAM